MLFAFLEAILAPFSLIPGIELGYEDSNKEAISGLVKDSDKCISDCNPL